MSKTYNDCLSTRIRLGNAMPNEEALADAAPELLAACGFVINATDAWPSEMGATIDAIRNACKAAIAKATK